MHGVGSNSPAIVDGVVYICASGNYVYAFSLAGATADLFLRIRPTLTTVHQGDLTHLRLPGMEPGA